MSFVSGTRASQQALGFFFSLENKTKQSCRVIRCFVLVLRKAEIKRVLTALLCQNLFCFGGFHLLNFFFLGG